MHYDEDDTSFCETTVSLTLWVTPEQQKKALEVGNYEHWTWYDNCIDHVVKSLDAIGYPHSSFKPSPIGISDPTLFCNWIIEENKHIHPNFVLGEGDIVPYETNLLPQATQEQSSLFHANYGGVSISKTAELMTSISDIAGAVFDQKTGQIILYGKKERSLPQMHLDDLAVAIRSVYGLGEKGEEDPGISLDSDPASSKMKATYYGETQNTRFGQVMLEADELLKQLIVGKDGAGKKLKAHVHGYRNLFDLCKKNNYFPRDLTCRMWFVPERISLIQSEDGTSMQFDDVRMQVLTESKFQGKERQDPVAEKFATHFTQNYDAYSQEFPILQDLKRLGKITGVVKWIKEQDIPFDLSFFKNYIPEFIHTPTYVDRIGNFNYGILMSGGVVYHLGPHNFHSIQDREADHLKQEILAHRSSEEEFAWDLGKGYTAVAQTFAKTLKVGEVRKTFTDMQFPLPGKKTLGFTRTYNSFSEDHSGLGTGWEVTPAKLRFPDQTTWQRFSDNTTCKAHREIFVNIGGIEALYRLTGLNEEGHPLYETQGKSFSLVQDSHETFTLQESHAHLHFDSQGKLTKITYPGSVDIDYVYEDQRLIAISSGKKTIHFEYSGPHIQRVIGPGNKTIEYDYTPEGQLKAVRDQEGILMSYDYDEDKHLTAIFDANGYKTFEATYDAYHRAIEKKKGETHLNQHFSLQEKTARLETTDNFFLEEQFDDLFRPKIIQDALGRTLEYQYASDFGPEKQIDHNGLEISYEYDQFGNLTKITDVYRGERRFEFDQQGHLLEETDGRGLTTAYRYDRQGRLIKIYKPFHLTQLTVREGEVIKEGNERFATTLHYDSSGNLVSIEFPNGTRRDFEYDDNGLPLKICFENGCISERKYDENCRLIAISEAGRTLNYTYNERDQITSISSSSGTTRYSHDRLENILSITDALEKTTHFTYDEHHHLCQVTDALGSVTLYEYSPQGNLTKICLPNGSSREIAYDTFQRPIALK
jgi:YD repeat-containing protein